MNDLSVAQAFSGCVRTASGSDRIRKSRSVSKDRPDPVATAPGSDTEEIGEVSCESSRENFADAS